MTDEPLRIPLAVSSGPLDDRPLLLLLHGFGSNEVDLPGITGSLPDRFQWASLRAPITLSTGSYAWVPITTPGLPDPDGVRAAARGILEWIDASVEPGVPIVPVGFSQGGLMVTHLLRLRRERFAGGAVLSGFVLQGEDAGDEALAAARPPVFWARGDVDRVITPDAFARTDAWLEGHATATSHVYPGLAHGISRDELRDLSVWLDEVVAPAA